MTEMRLPDIALRVMVGGDNTLIDPLFRSMLRGAAIGGKFIIATDGTGRIVGVSIWFGPGYSLFASSVGPSRAALILIYLI